MCVRTKEDKTCKVGGQGEETWDRLNAPKTEAPLLTRLLPWCTKILTVSTGMCVALLLFKASVSLCSHTHFNCYTHTHQIFSPVPETPSRAESEGYLILLDCVIELLEPGISAQRFVFPVFSLKCTNTCTHSFWLEERIIERRHGEEQLVLTDWFLGTFRALKSHCRGRYKVSR